VLAREDLAVVAIPTLDVYTQRVSHRRQTNPPLADPNAITQRPPQSSLPG
jgi:hypothetical protein